MQQELQGGAAGPALSLLPRGETRVMMTAWAPGSRAKLAVPGGPSAPAAAPPPFAGCQQALCRASRQGRRAPAVAGPSGR